MVKEKVFPAKFDSHSGNNEGINSHYFQVNRWESIGFEWCYIVEGKLVTKVDWHGSATSDL